MRENWFATSACTTRFYYEKLCPLLENKMSTLEPYTYGGGENTKNSRGIVRDWIPVACQRTEMAVLNKKSEYSLLPSYRIILNVITLTYYIILYIG